MYVPLTSATGALADAALAAGTDDPVLLRQAEDILALVSIAALDAVMPVLVDVVRRCWAASSVPGSVLRDYARDEVWAQALNEQESTKRAVDGLVLEPLVTLTGAWVGDGLRPLFGDRADVLPVVLARALCENSTTVDVRVRQFSRQDVLLMLAGCVGTLSDSGHVDVHVDRMFDAALARARRSQETHRGLPGSPAWTSSPFEGGLVRQMTGMLVEIGDSVQLDDEGQFAWAWRRIEDQVGDVTVGAPDVSEEVLTAFMVALGALSSGLENAYADDDDPTVLRVFAVEEIDALADEVAGQIRSLVGERADLLGGLLRASLGYPADLDGLVLSDCLVVLAAAVGFITGRGRCDIEVQWREVLDAYALLGASSTDLGARQMMTFRVPIAA